MYFRARKFHSRTNNFDVLNSKQLRIVCAEPTKALALFLLANWKTKAHCGHLNVEAEGKQKGSRRKRNNDGDGIGGFCSFHCRITVLLAKRQIEFCSLFFAPLSACAFLWLGTEIKIISRMFTLFLRVWVLSLEWSVSRCYLFSSFTYWQHTYTIEWTIYQQNEKKNLRWDSTEQNRWKHLVWGTFELSRRINVSRMFLVVRNPL